MRTAIINSVSYEKHITGDGHPEQPKRVIAIKEKLRKSGPRQLGQSKRERLMTSGGHLDYI